MARSLRTPARGRFWRGMHLALLPLLPALVGQGALAQGGWRQPAAPPPPPPGGTAPALGEGREGRSVAINGRRQSARWLWTAATAGSGGGLWLPLELLQGQLGVSSRSRTDGALELEWFGLALTVPAGSQRSLDDEVAVEANALLEAAGARLGATGDTLQLDLPPPALLRVRASAPGAGNRVVLDLTGAAVVRQDDGQLLVAVRSTPSQRAQLIALGVGVQEHPDGLRIGSASAGRVLTLGTPPRLVLDRGGAESSATAPQAPPLDPRLQALLAGSVAIDRQVRSVGERRLLISSVRLDPRNNPLELRLLTRPDGMEGLSSLPALAQREQALVAINGGFFNRVRRLPLGALRDQGRWLSGPILNRGAVGWRPGALPLFGRLGLAEWLSDEAGRRWPVTAVNSGYIQRGLARYSADWGRFYRALSGNEAGLLINGGVVRQQLDADLLERGVPLGPDDQLVVGRAGVTPPWPVGTRLSLESRPTDPVGAQPYVMGGGPLLLQAGRVVLNGTAEGFSPAFQRQGAPRTVIGSDGMRLWLITLEGVEHSGPTLAETALALRHLGLSDALNLDGGSSTGLLVGGAVTVRGRGVSASIHNALGLVPRDGRIIGSLAGAAAPGGSDAMTGGGPELRPWGAPLAD